MLAIIWALASIAAAVLVYRLYRRGHAVSAAIVVWAAFAAYEVWFRATYCAAGECSIRADRILLAPVLLAVTLAAIVAAVRSAWRRRSRKPR